MTKLEKTILISVGVFAAIVVGVGASFIYQARTRTVEPTAVYLVVTTAPQDTATSETSVTQLAAFTEPPTGTPQPTASLSATDTVASPSETPVLAQSSATASPAIPPTAPSVYIVQAGDSLFAIAARFNTTIDALKAVNSLNSNLIYPGQKLTIPVPGLIIPTNPPPTNTPPPATLPSGASLAPTATVSIAPATATSAPLTGGSFGAAAIPGPSPTWSVSAFPTRFPASGPTKLGLHVTLNGGGVLDYVKAVHPPVMKGVDDVGYLRDVKALSPNTITIGRFTVDQPNIGQGDPAQRAIDFVNQMLPKYQANKDWVDYWEGWNEVTYPNYEWYAQFEAARACEMKRLGFKAAIGGFSTGTPEPWQFEAFIPAIEAGIRCGAILTTHEYGAPTLYLWFSQGLPASYGHDPVPAYPDRGPLMGRYRFLYYNMLLPRGLNIPLVISEAGIDGGAGAGQRPGYSNAQGWMGFEDYWGRELGQNDPVQFYVDQLAWYDSMLRQDSFVIGATIFNVGNGGTWASFDAAPILPKLTDYALSLP